MSRKAKKHEHVNHERWLVSYADFITLLFAFFVVMFAVSQVDSKKLGRFVESVNVAFQIEGIFPENQGSPLRGAGGGNSIVPMVVSPRPSMLTHSLPSPRAKALLESLTAKVREAGCAGDITLRHDPRGVALALHERAFFRTGTADFRSEALAKLLAVGELLRLERGAIQVEAHTDDSGAVAAPLASTWELTATRAARVAQFLVDEAGVEPERLCAAGLAEFHPLTRSAVPEEVELGRRVDLVLITELPGEGG